MMNNINIINYIQNRWMVIARILYFVLSLAIILVLIYERSHLIKPLPPPIQQPTVDIDSINKSIANLERETNSQLNAIKTLETKIEEQKATTNNLDKKLQLQLEFNKRICEYIWVITIDKKIVPRKCTPDFNWTKEVER